MPQTQYGWSSVNAQALMRVFEQRNLIWRDCKLKSHTLYACKLPSDVVYANRITQPESYKCLMDNFHQAFVPAFKIAERGLKQFLMHSGCYITDDKHITMCGTQGEMWECALEAFAKLYHLEGNKPIDISKIQIGFWVPVLPFNIPSHADELGVQLPLDIAIKLPDGGSINNLNAPNHGKGDILILPKTSTGSPCLLATPKAVHNYVFATTYDKSVGGWAQSGGIASPMAVKQNMPNVHKLNKLLAMLQKDVFSMILKM